MKIRHEPLEVGGFFHRDDILAGDVMYENDGEDAGDDGFMVDISDGVHHVPVKFKVAVKVSARSRFLYTPRVKTIKPL